MAAFACAHRAYFGTPLTCSVAPKGAPPTAAVAAFACAHRTHFGTPLTCFVALQGAPRNAVHTTTVLTTAYGW
eukprot:124429-Pyramimonas_sp.AAC.1